MIRHHFHSPVCCSVLGTIRHTMECYWVL